MQRSSEQTGSTGQTGPTGTTGPTGQTGPGPDASAVLRRFSAPTRSWFSGAFAAPTEAQLGAWSAVAAGDHALVVAPTGSGKTLAAFLWALDGLLTADGPPPEASSRCRVLYVSPLKALATDVDRNLRSPLVGIRQEATRAGTELPDVRVGTRTGDTPPTERRAFATRPPDILITTPESLYLVLTSGARAGLAGVRTVIVDEIHAVAGTKRGAHLALSLERLDALLDVEGGPGPAQRIGLSATVRPAEAVARFLGGARRPEEGGRAVRVVQPPSHKVIDVRVVVPVPDLTDLDALPVRVAPGPAAAPDEQDGDAPDLSGPADGPLRRPSIWPHVEERVVDLVAEHRSTLVFTNSRRGAERLTARMNEVWADRHGVPVPDPGGLQPAAVPAESGTAVGIDTRDAATILARAHHGSMSRAERTRTESELKAGRLPAVVATSSLELGIDMGAIDLVVQVGSPPSVASGLQRIGRAGHQVGAASRGVVFPAFRGELVPAAVTAVRMRAGELEELHVPANPLDVLAQQIVAMVALEDWTVDELARVVRRAAPYTGLGDQALRAVLDMLAGRYPSEEFAELRPRIVWDRVGDVLTGRPGALRLAVTSGGTIPDRGLYGVFLADGSGGGAATGAATGAGTGAGTGTDGISSDGIATDTERSGGRARGGKRVGELDEEMVYESRVGDTFTLGSSTWRIEDITPDRVLVSPAPGIPGRLPFWKGDAPGRPAELGRAMGAWVRELSALPDDEARDRVGAAGLDPWAVDNLTAYLAEQREATGVVPDDRTLLVERFRDELGDWRIVVHSPYGARVHAPWAIVLGARLRDRYGVDVAALHSDDGIVLRLPDVLDDGDDLWADPGAGGPGGSGGSGPDGGGPSIGVADLVLDPEEVVDAVRAELGSSAMFAGRFREAAGRALLLPRRRPDRRQPLWQQRQRSAQLLEVAARYPDFPILLEAVRECLQDDFDTTALADLMREVAHGTVRVVEVTTPSPSPFAQSMMFGYTAQFLYDGDAPLAERRAAALTLDPTLLAELLGQGGASQLADLLDPDVVLRTEAEIAATAPDRRARTLEQLADVVRRHGPLTRQDVLARVAEDARAQADDWLTELEATRRVIRVRIGGRARTGPGGASDAPPGLGDPATGGWGGATEHWAAIEDAGRLRDALGVALPVGVPEAFTEVLPDPWGDLVRRHARTHGPFTTADLAGRFGMPVAVVAETLDRLERAGALARGRLRPDVLGGSGEEFCDADVLRLLRRRSLAALRSAVEPVPPAALGVFLPRWQSVVPVAAGPPAVGSAGASRSGRGGRGVRGVDGLARVVEQLAGAVVPASALETLVLPARVVDYSPAMLDELTSAGEVLWAGHGALAGKDGLVSLHPTATADLTLPAPLVPPGPSGPPAPPGPPRPPGPTAPSVPGGELPVVTAAVLAALADRGAYFVGGLADRVGRILAEAVAERDGAHDRAEPDTADTPPSGTGGRPGQAAVADALWELVWAGRVTNDGLAPLRAWLGSGSTAHRTRRPAPRGRTLGPRLGLRPAAGPGAGPLVGGHAGGRWSLLPEPEADPTVRSHALAAQLLDRHGVLTRAVAPSEGVAGRFTAVYRVLAALENAGQVRRGYFVEHLGGSQFALPGAVDQLRADGADVADDELSPGRDEPGPDGPDPEVVVLAATDPANPYGAALAWPAAPPGPAETARRHRPGRKAGAVVVLVGGSLALYVERGGRTLLSFTTGERALAVAARGLATVTARGSLGRLTISRIDGAEVLADRAVDSAAGRALVAAGFGPTPRGLRRREPPRA